MSYLISRLSALMIAAAVLVVACGAGMVTTFDGQNIPKEETAKLHLNDKVGRRNLDSIMYCFVIEIDGVNLADSFDLHTSDPEYFVREEELELDEAARLDRLFAEFELANRLRSFNLTPGTHEVKTKMAARNSMQGTNDLIYSLEPAALQFEVEAGHTYQPSARFDRDIWIAWIEDKNTGLVVATNHPELISNDN